MIIEIKITGLLQAVFLFSIPGTVFQILVFIFRRDLCAVVLVAARTLDVQISKTYVERPIMIIIESSFLLGITTPARTKGIFSFRRTICTFFYKYFVSLFSVGYRQSTLS